MSFDKNDCPMEVIGRNHVRTEFQVRAWEGPEGIRAADRLTSSSGSHTPMLAVPDEWTKQAKCVDDWKAFDDGSARRTVAEQLCLDCPVMSQCLDQAMADERTIAPALRSGIRGGLNIYDRYKLSKGAPVPEVASACPSEHPRAEFGFWDGRRWRCDECIRVANATMETCTCGRTMRRNTLYTHRRRQGCAKPAATAHVGGGRE